MRIVTPFTLTKTLLALGAGWFASNWCHAQQVAVALPGQHVLGERAFEASLGVVNVDALDEQGYSASVGLHLPATKNLDVGVHYGRAWIDDVGVGLTDSTVSTNAVVHAAGPGPKPFAGVLLGYQRMEMKVGPFHVTDNSGVWGAGAGVELPMGKGTITPSVSYTDSLDGTTDRTVHFTVHGNYWFTPKFGGYADVTYSEFDGEGDNAWACRLGLRLKW